MRGEKVESLHAPQGGFANGKMRNQAIYIYLNKPDD